MRNFNFLILGIVLTVTFFNSCATSGRYPVNTDIEFQYDTTVVFYDKYIVVKKLWDEESETTYYLTRINHKDEHGDILRLRVEATKVDSGETIPQFATRLGNPMIATNASTVLSNKAPWPKTSTGILIKDGKILGERDTKFFTLGVKRNNELVAYPPGTTAREIIKDGAQNAITAFTPIIRDYLTVPDSIIGLEAHHLEKHPRQVIAQFGNKDILYLSCGGRGFDGAGMTISDVERILKALKEEVKFAYNLDGGGSTTTVLYGNQLTKKIDKEGTENRTRTNCLYIRVNDR